MDASVWKMAARQREEVIRSSSRHSNHVSADKHQVINIAGHFNEDGSMSSRRAVELTEGAATKQIRIWRAEKEILRRDRRQ